MKAVDYLSARCVGVFKPVSSNVGRLSIESEFTIAGKRGVVVSPKRGSVSDRYLSLLSAEGVSFVVAEGGSTLSFYEAASKAGELHPVRALKPDNAQLFPSQAVFEYLLTLLRLSMKEWASIDTVASNLLVARIADEEAGKEGAWVCSIAGTLDECSGLISRIKGKLKDADINAEGVLKLCAVLAGFRLKPVTPEASAQLIDWVARASDNKTCIHGLPLALSPIFQSMGEITSSKALITSALGAQFSILSGSCDDEVVLENGNQALLSLLQVLYPNTTFINGDYLGSKPVKKKDAIVLIPPFGRSMQLKKDAALTTPFFNGNPASKKYPAEYLYLIKVIDQCKPDGLITVVLPEGILSGASHRAFRDWMLDSVQILGIVSLPPGFCFSGTGIRCSILFMKKTIQLPDDYSISMIEMRQEDFESDAIVATIETVKAVLNPGDRE
jgi:hypothetical protein